MRKPLQLSEMRQSGQVRLARPPAHAVECGHGKFVFRCRGLGAPADSIQWTCLPPNLSKLTRSGNTCSVVLDFSRIMP